MKKIDEIVQKFKHKTAFTLAEILVTLSIVAVVSAMTIPALLTTVDEKVYLTQRKALVARLTSAVTQLDKVSGFGTNINDYAESFIIQLSKVYKMNSICDSSDVSACDIPASVITMNGETKLDILDGKQGKKLSELNDKFTEASAMEGSISLYKDSTPAAFVTINGESVLVFYNPRCTGVTGSEQPIQKIMCVNFIYDLNGKKSPNRVGKDIGFATVFSNRDSVVAGPIALTNDFANGATVKFGYDDSVTNCGKNMANRIPDIDEIGSIFTNKFLLGTAGTDFKIDGNYWSGSAIASGDTNSYAWAQDFINGNRAPDSRTNTGYVRCVVK